MKKFEYQIHYRISYIDEFLNCVEFIDNIRNPYGIYNHMREYALKNGIQHKKTVDYGDGPIEVDDYYEENNPVFYNSHVASALFSIQVNGGTRQSF